MNIGAREIGLDQPPYVIAEIGVNHDGEVARALELTDAAADAGADAVKLQFFETDRLMSKAAKLAAYQRAAGETDPIAMLRRLELTLDEMAMVVDRAHERGIHAIVTVFSTELVDAAETLAWDAYKTASPDIVNRPLLDRLAETGEPMIVSTGASTLDEVVRAVGWLERVRDRLAVLQCVSSYPAPTSAMGGVGALYDALPDVAAIGYSAHLIEDEIYHAHEFGAAVLEAHITYDRRASGPDHGASLDPNAFSALTADLKFRGWMPKEFYERGMTEQCRVSAPDESTFVAAGFVKVKEVLDCERDVRTVSRQSVVSTRGIPAGTVIGSEHLTIKRPGTGILAYRLDEVIGKKTARDIEGDVPIVEDDLVGGLQ